MNKYSLKKCETFKSEIEKAVIIGGETDYCADRYSYTREANGIFPSPYFQRQGFYSCSNVWYTEYLPLIGLVGAATSDGYLYTWNPAEKSLVLYRGMLTQNYPSFMKCVIDGVNTYIFLSGNWFVKLTPDNKSKQVNYLAKVISTVMHCGRIFGVDVEDNYMIRWSGYEFNDWVVGVDRGGYVQLGHSLGKILNLFVMNDKIVALREKGITTFNTLGDSRHSRLDITDKHVLNGVYANSSVICRGKLWIYTQKGMFTYDGNTISKAPFDEYMTDYVLEGPKVIEDRYIYYNAVRDDEKYLFVYDTETGAGTPFAKTCRCIFFADDGIYCMNGNYFNNVVPGMNDPNRYWLSKPFTSDDGRPRVLKSLTVEGSGQFKIEVSCDGRKLYVDSSGKYNYAECAKSFTFKVTGNGPVYQLTAEWEVRK